MHGLLKEAASKCKCSKTDVAPIMKKLEKLGAITLIKLEKLEGTQAVQLCIGAKCNMQDFIMLFHNPKLLTSSQIV